MLNPPKILIVDDEPRMCESLKVLLSSRDYELKACNSVKGAIEYLEKNAYDLVLLDLVLPDISGSHIIDYIKHKNPDTLIIVITGQVLLESAIGTFKHGVYDIFKKPFEPDNLLTSVKNALDYKKLVAEQKTTEALLRESELKFRTFFDLSPQAVIFMDCETDKIFDINQKFTALVHFFKEEVVGKSPVELGIYSQEDGKLIHDILQRSEEVRGLEMDLRAKDGSVSNTLMYARYVRLEDRAYILSIFNDITEQKKLEIQKSHETKISGEDIIEEDDIILLVDQREKIDEVDTQAVVDPDMLPPAIEPLIQLLNDKDNDARREAAGALGMIGDPRAVMPLITLIQPDNLKTDNERKDEELDIFSNFDDFDLDFETDYPESEQDVSVRIVAAGALGMIGDPRAADPLISTLADHDDAIRRAAASALGKIGAPRAVMPLISALEDHNSDVRREAAEALGMIGDPRATTALISALDDQHSEVRREAAGALGKIGDPRAVEPLIKFIKRMKLKKNDAYIEEELNIDLIFDDLESDLVAGHQEEDPAEMIQMVSKTIVQIGEKAIEPLMQVLESEDNDQELNQFAEAVLYEIKYG
jgi:PAS domain S-box-containing protein